MAGEPSKMVNKQSSNGYSLLSLQFDPEDGDRTASIYYIYYTLETCRLDSKLHQMEIVLSWQDYN
jgi:hypothetical protein